MAENTTLINETEIKKSNNWILNLPIIFAFLMLFIFNFLTAPLANKDVMIHVPTGQSIGAISEDLAMKRAVRYSSILKILVLVLKNDKGITSGDYLIKSKTPVWTVAWQLALGRHNVDQLKITFPEGLNNEEVAAIFAHKLASFRKDLFLAGTYGQQGYLFPDTYYFYPLDTTDELIQKFNNNFNNRIKKLDLTTSSKNLNQILTMASILEGEASGSVDAGLIAGILWKRISLNMPLQVDVDKRTYSDLGLPKEPLNNPGLTTIMASLNPVDSPYLYYLHDKTGVVHYAKSYEEHKLNIKKYLK